MRRETRSIEQQRDGVLIETPDAGQRRARALRVDFAIAIVVHAHERVQARAHNLSATGILVETDARMPIGQEVDLEFTLDHWNHVIRGAVARVDAAGVAFQFVNLDKDARLALVTYIARQRAEAEVRGLKGRDPAETVAISDPALTAAINVQDDDPSAGPDPALQPVSSSDDDALADEHDDGQADAERPRSGFLGFAFTLAMLTGGTFAFFRLGGLDLLPAKQADGVRSALASVTAALPTTTSAAAPTTTSAPPPTAPAAVPTAASTTTSEPTSAPTDPRLAGLLADGQALFAAGKWSLPAGNSALDRLREVIAIDPTNAAAATAIADICDGYARRAWEVRADGDAAGARWRYERILGILAEFGPIVPDGPRREAAARAALDS